MSISFAKKLRHTMTDAEVRLWSRLRGHRLNGFGFRRQEPFRHYVLDFVCYQARLVVEVDGGQHTEDTDRERTAFLEAEGFRVMRFWNNEVLTNTDGVLETILNACLQSPSTLVGEGLGWGVSRREPGEES